jgi:hypothetical protein
VNIGCQLTQTEAYWRGKGDGVVAAYCRPVANPQCLPPVTHKGADGTLFTVNPEQPRDYLWIIVHKRLPTGQATIGVEMVRLWPASGSGVPVPVYVVYVCDYPDDDGTWPGRARPRRTMGGNGTPIRCAVCFARWCSPARRLRRPSPIPARSEPSATRTATRIGGGRPTTYIEPVDIGGHGTPSNRFHPSCISPQMMSHRRLFGLIRKPRSNRHQNQNVCVCCERSMV